jgi:uncharacterized protein
MDISKVKQFVEDKLDNESSGHDYLHALRVYENAMELIIDLDINKPVVEVAALIHDLIDVKLDDKDKVSFEEIKLFLNENRMNSKDINHIENIIENVSYSKGNIPNSIEGKIVQDADRLDALGAIGIARTFAYGGKKGRLIYKLDTIDSDDSVSHFYQKLFKLTDLMNTDKAKKIAVERTEFMKLFIKTLYKEVSIHTMK